MVGSVHHPQSRNYDFSNYSGNFSFFFLDSSDIPLDKSRNNRNHVYQQDRPQQPFARQPVRAGDQHRWCSVRSRDQHGRPQGCPPTPSVRLCQRGEINNPAPPRWLPRAALDHIPYLSHRLGFCLVRRPPIMRFYHDSSTNPFEARAV